MRYTMFIVTYGDNHMAYINAETAKNIRQALKKEFPKVKFSVRKDGAIALRVAVMKSDLFDDGVEMGVNHFWIDTSEQFNDDQKAFLKKVDEIIRVTGEHFDDSDSMTDYFHCAFYYDISVGTFDKPHQKA